MFSLQDLRDMTGRRSTVTVESTDSVVKAALDLPSPLTAIVEAVKLRESRYTTESLDGVAARAGKVAPNLGFKPDASAAFQALARKVAIMEDADVVKLARHARLGLAEWTVTEGVADQVNDDIVRMLKESRRSLVESVVPASEDVVRGSRPGMMFAPPEFVIESKRLDAQAVDRWWSCVEQAANAGTTFLEGAEGKIRPNFAGVCGCWASKVAEVTDWRLSARKLGKLAEEMTQTAAMAVGKL